jgi:hypothetical protein
MPRSMRRRPRGAAEVILGHYGEHRAAVATDERFGGDPRRQLRLEIDVKPVEAPAPAHLARSAGRHQPDRSGGGRNVSFHLLKPQVQLLRRPRDKDEPVVRPGGRSVRRSIHEGRMARPCRGYSTRPPTR